MIHVDFKDRTPIWEQLTRNITHLVVSGVLAPNEQLPSVRQLSGELGINPNTIQKAYSELERRGITYTVAGKGCFVTENTDRITQTKQDEISEKYRALTKEAMQAHMTRQQIDEIISAVFAEQGGSL